MPAMRDKYPPKGGNTHPNTQVNMRSSQTTLHATLIPDNTHDIMHTSVLDVPVPAVMPSGSFYDGLLTHWEIGGAHR